MSDARKRTVFPCRTPATLRGVRWRTVLSATALGAVYAVVDPVMAAEVSFEPPPVVDAVAKSDAEINLWLTRATTAVQSGKPDDALPFIVRILKADPGAMATTNGVVYRPARQLALNLLAVLPEKTLTAYRLQADAWTGVPSGQMPPPADLAALETLYRTALPGGAVTAAAGQRLAGLYLDQERFVAARTVLRRLLDEGAPDAAQRPDLLARLVLACSRIGDDAQAQEAWTALQQSGATSRWAFLEAELRRPRPLASTPVNAWTMAYSNPARSGAATEESADRGSVTAWSLRWSVDLGPGLVRRGLSVESRTNLPPILSLSGDVAVTRMTGKLLRPSDDVVFAGNRGWVNGFEECVTLDLDSGHAIRRVPHVDDDPANTGPGAMDGAWAFGNRLNRALSVIGTTVYCIEDNYRSAFRSGAVEQREWDGKRFVYRTLPNGNALAAYDTEMGRLRWRIGREVSTNTLGSVRAKWLVNGVRFAAAPVPCGGLVVVPVEDDFGLCIVGLDADSGAPVWRTRLTAGVPSVGPRGALVNITVDGTSAYICAGNGFIYAFDGCDGSVRWASLCPRPGDTPADARPARDRNRELPWEESLVLVEGDTIVAMPEDSVDILALDRRRGTRLWTAAKPDGVDYMVGRRGATLIAAGRQAVVGVSLTDGRERWRTPIEGSTGRGTLWGQQVLIPCNRTILRLSAADGAALEPARAHTTEDLPLGNLYANGDQLLVTGLERLYALVDARPLLARLQERLSQQPAAETYAERGARYAGLGQYPEAVADLREAWTRQRGMPAESTARAALLNALWQAARQVPARTETFCAEARSIASTPVEQAESIWRWGQCRERAGDTNGAIAMYATAFGAPDEPLAPQGHERDWSVSSHRLAARRLSALLADPGMGTPLSASGQAEGVALLEQPAAQALAAFGSKAGTADLTELATFFAGTRAGTAAALKAAKLATARGDLGTAEAILQRSLALTAPASRMELAKALAQLYERMKWPKGAARLRDDWPRLGGGTPLPDFLARAPTLSAGAPPPPWRLRWRTSLPARSSMLPVGGGLYYHTTNQTGCLDFETGKPRWQVHRVFGAVRGYDTDWSDRHLLLVFTGDAGGCVDVWSGMLMTHDLFKGRPEWVHDSGGHDRNPMSLSRIGLATVRYGESDTLLAGVDVLTGHASWRRGDVDSLHGWWTPAFVEPAMRIFLMSHDWDTGGRIATETDLWTGETKPPRIFDPGEYTAWTRRMSSREGRDDPFAGDRGVPVLNDRRLTVKNLRTGATLWSSPPELAVSSHLVLPGGFVAVYGDANEWVVLDGEDGHVVCRAAGGPARLNRAERIGDAIIVAGEALPGTNTVVVFDRVGKRIAFQGQLPQSMPVKGFVASLPNHLLATVPTNNRPSLAVVNEKGQCVGPWQLPRPEDVRKESSPNYTAVIVDGLILMSDYQQGSVLAYEHDPDGDGKPPAAGAAP